MNKQGVIAVATGCLLLAPLVLSLASEPSTTSAGDDPWPTKGWANATPASVGLDASVLEALDKDLAAGKFSLVDSFAVFRCGKQVYERTYPHDYAKIYGKQAKEKGPLNARLTGPYNYFDPYWHPYFHGTDLHSMQSVSKTVTSVIIGIAKTRGDFKAGVDTPVLKYFDVAKVKNVDDRKRRMTLRDLLTMTAGLAWIEDVPYDDPRSDSSLMEATDDWVQYVIDKPMAAEPGKVFNYSSGVSELLAYIFKKETGQDIDDYGEKYLFGPLGIRHHWKRTYLGVVDTERGLVPEHRRPGKDRVSLPARWSLGRQADRFERVGEGIGDAAYRCGSGFEVWLQMVAVSTGRFQRVCVDGAGIWRPAANCFSGGGDDRGPDGVGYSGRGGVRQGNYGTLVACA